VVKKPKDTEVYAKVVNAFKQFDKGATPADIVSKTGLPIERVKESAPVAADEFGARLRVTESGEILYSFPNGFKSRYTGFAPTMRRFWRAFAKGAASVAKTLFKVWIGVMLVGYFVLFMAIALVALVASVAVSFSGSGDDRSERRGGGMGGLVLATHLFDLIIRIWFYSELTKSFDDPYGRRRAARKQNRRPLHHAVFSFVFGDGDPNADWETRSRKAVLAYIQANRGVISLPEFISITGLSPEEADRAISSYMAEFGGTPEATEDGTVVYRFEELLRTSGKAETREAAPPLKRIKAFSSNPKKMNGWFIALNGVNLLFGAYFLFNALNVGIITQKAQITGGTYLYAVALVLFSNVPDPVALIASVLGIVPLAFAALFYAIPFIRKAREKAENERAKLDNLRTDAFRRAWEQPEAFSQAEIRPSAPECRPEDLDAAKERLLREIGTYAQPEVSIGENGATNYSFPALKEEKAALEAYRAAIDTSKYELGKTIFDSHN